MDAEREAEHLVPILLGWLVAGKDAEAVQGLSAALLRAHAAGRREAVEECVEEIDRLLADADESSVVRCGALLAARPNLPVPPAPEDRS